MSWGCHAKLSSEQHLLQEGPLSCLPLAKTPTSIIIALPWGRCLFPTRNLPGSALQKSAMHCLYSETPRSGTQRSSLILFLGRGIGISPPYSSLASVWLSFLLTTPVSHLLSVLILSCFSFILSFLSPPVVLALCLLSPFFLLNLSCPFSFSLFLSPLLSHIVLLGRKALSLFPHFPDWCEAGREAGRLSTVNHSHSRCRSHILTKYHLPCQPHPTLTPYPGSH